MERIVDIREKKSIISILLNAVKQLFTTIYSNGKLAFGFSLFFVFVFLAVFGQELFPYSEATDYANKFAPMSSEHWLGTDYMGRDVFRQLVAGCKSAVYLSLMTALFTVAIGVALGMISGYCGGIVDKVIQMITNIVLNIPTFPILLVLSTFITIEDDLTFAIILSIFSWAGLCRAIRAQIMSLKERDFIQICTVMNMKQSRIIFNELLPNIYSYIIVNFVMTMRSSITASVGIMTLGLAAFKATNWGVILYQARIMGLISPQVIAYMLKALVAVVIYQISVILMANGLDEVFNPRLKRM